MRSLDKLTDEMMEAGVYDRFVPLVRQHSRTNNMMKLILEYTVIFICILSFIGGFNLICKIVFERLQTLFGKKTKKEPTDEE